MTTPDEKSLWTVLRAARNLSGLEERKQLQTVMRRQYGLWRQFRIITKGVRKRGRLQSLKDIRKFQLSSLVACAYIASWEVLGKREAIIDGDRRFTFEEMSSRILRLANGLQSLGIAPGDRVGCMLYNSAEFFEVFYAACLIGTPLPPVNWHLSGDELATTINLRGPKVFMFDQAFAPEILKIRDKLTSVDNLIMVGDDTPPPGALRYEPFLAKNPETLPKTSFIVALNPYTGGTTGTPKSSNLHDSFSYLFSSTTEAPRSSLEDYMRYMMKEYSYFHHYGAADIKDPRSDNIRALIVTPMYHAGTAAGYSPCVMLGATAVIMRRFDPEEYLQMIEKERISWAFAVPTILQRILTLPEDVKSRYDLSSMHTLISAAAPCPPKVKTEINHLFMRQGARQPIFHEYYGSAETGLITALLPADYMEKPERIRSVGKARCGDLMIYDDLNNRVAAPGEEGRVMGRTVASMSLRYPGTESELKTNRQIIDNVEWYDDKLIGYMDEDGFLYLTGRIKEMIISGGVNIFPAEIEEILINNGKIADVAVIKGPDPDLGEVPLACVQPAEGVTLAETEIIEFCREQGLTGFKLPKRVIFYDELPRHIDGKLLKRKLEKEFWKDTEQHG